MSLRKFGPPDGAYVQLPFIEVGDEAERAKRGRPDQSSVLATIASGRGGILTLIHQIWCQNFETVCVVRSLYFVQHRAPVMNSSQNLRGEYKCKVYTLLIFIAVDVVCATCWQLRLSLDSDSISVSRTDYQFHPGRSTEQRPRAYRLRVRELYG